MQPSHVNGGPVKGYQKARVLRHVWTLCGTERLTNEVFSSCLCLLADILDYTHYWSIVESTEAGLQGSGHNRPTADTEMKVRHLVLLNPKFGFSHEYPKLSNLWLQMIWVHRPQEKARYTNAELRYAITRWDLFSLALSFTNRMKKFVVI